MTMIKDQVRSYVVDNFVMGSHAAKFSDADSFLDLHIIDSTGFLELVTYLEENFKFRVEDEEMIPENLGLYAPTPHLFRVLAWPRSTSSTRTPR